MSHATLVIEINLEEKTRPTPEELEWAGYAYEVDYWIDFMYMDAPQMLNGATWEIIE